MSIKPLITAVCVLVMLYTLNVSGNSAVDQNTVVNIDLFAAVQKAAEAQRQDLINLRRDFHMFPELSGQEVRTAGIVAQRLRDLGLEVRTGVGGYGVVGILRGAKPGPVVAYRADMDAFPSEIVGEQSYRSQVPGVKHICGHDVHTTVALGMATVLSSMSDDLPGTVMFIFQPAEEDGTGALAMLADGVLANPVPEAIFAMHTAPVPVGKIVLNSGAGLSAFRNFEISWAPSAEDELKAPQLIEALDAINTVQSAAEVVTNPEVMKDLIEEFMTQKGSLTRFKNVQATHQAGQALVNIRTKAPTMKQLDEIEEEIKLLVEVFNQAGAAYKLKLTYDLPAMRQDQDLIRQARKPIEVVVGTEGIMTSYGAFPYNGEDFSYFLEKIPGALFFLGVTNEAKGIRGINHLPDYDVDEESILIGTKAMSAVLLNYLIDPPAAIN